MDRMTSVKINGKDIFLNYSIAVMFEVADRFQNIQNALDIMNGSGVEAFEAVRWFAVHMANDAELCRRAMGYAPTGMLAAEDISTRRLRPLEYEELKGAIVDGITLGYQRELPEDEDKERDLGLEELQAKKTEAGV